MCVSRGGVGPEAIENHKAEDILNPPPHSTGRQLRYAHGDLGFSNRRGSVDCHTIWGLGASSTLPLRFYYALLYTYN